MREAICSICQRGVEVAPQIPMVLGSGLSISGSTSSGEETKMLRSLPFWQ